MRTTVVGGGAMGSIFAAALAPQCDVTVLDVSDEVVSAVNTRGVRVSVGDGTAAVPVRATTDPGEAIGDVVIVFVKAHHTPSVARTLGNHLAAGATVVSLQNGWGNADILASTVPPEQLVVGVTYHSCTTLAPGHVAHTGQGPTFVGPYLQDAAMDRAASIAALLAAAGFETAATSETRTEIWKKLVLNAATLPVAALTRLTAGGVADCPGPLALADDLAREAVAAGRALGLALDLEERLERIHAVLAAAGPGKPSMLQDVLAQRKTEIEVVSGAVVAAARGGGLAAPLNTAMVSLIHGLERSWSA
jgi:2-dehydropantoate 2-reductase